MGQSKWLSITQTCRWDTCPTVYHVILVPSGGWSGKDETSAAAGWRNCCECQGPPCSPAGPGFRIRYIEVFSGRLGKQRGFMKGVKKFAHVTCGVNKIILKMSLGLQEMGLSISAYVKPPCKLKAHVQLLPQG